MEIPRNKISPIIKWSGSKRKIAPILSKLIPNSNRYLEPFIGGGSMLPFRKIENCIASDIIVELIELWKELQRNPENIKNEYTKRWNELQTLGPDFFYKVRDKFNQEKNVNDFLFLTRTCVNGLIRFNQNGEFNNSFHLTRPGINPNNFSYVIEQWHLFLKNVEFRISDYRDIFDIANKNDFLFLDPPYAGNKDRYKKIDFNIHEFYLGLDNLNRKECKWMLTFDGNAGSRIYDFPIPKDLYKHKIIINTGNSPFTKMMKTTIDPVLETVYFNYEVKAISLDYISDNVNQEMTLF